MSLSPPLTMANPYTRSHPPDPSRGCDPDPPRGNSSLVTPIPASLLSSIPLLVSSLPFNLHPTPTSAYRNPALLSCYEALNYPI